MQRLEAPPSHLSPREKAEYFLRIHMSANSRSTNAHPLHPRVLDVLEGY